ncbi:hypothetical protein C5167_027866 [Papaver somniferum]|uniref:stigma-specific STIG1-like protein 3 n=1 Tax=Papaver somniferum TaxID=3469 RepID=UPI000E701EA0|nr:stigma-specific STIG1-like protein 3 [Papaver somniferum]RZC91801.1 hypothetical protein C5167_027866 [Papaver somniferum]
MAITIVLTIATIHQGGGMDHQGGVSVASKEYSLSRGNEHNDILSSTSSTSKAKRISRFLKEEVKPKNPRAASHCNKNDNVCYAEGSPGTTCCNNKCVNLTSDSDNCGACKSKCKFYTETCCNGICVNLSYDKRHCGRCNNKCTTGGICLYGNCDYA